MRSQRGQAAAEYMGILFIVALIIAAIVGTGLPGKVAGGARDAVCSITGAACSEPAPPQRPAPPPATG
jgi:hypothetical protein